MKSSDYWEKRALQREAEAFESTADTIKRLRGLYSDAGKRLADMSKTIFANYLSLTGLDEAEAKKLLSAEDTAKLLDELREEFMATGSAEALAKLNAPAYGYRISKVQALRKAIEAETAALAAVEKQIGEKHLVKAYDDGYYKTMYDAAAGNGGDVNFSALPYNTVVEAVENKWKGQNYSSRVWDNTEKIAQEAGKIIDAGISAGQSVYKMAYDLKDLLNVGSYVSERLIRTETNRMHNDAARAAYKAMGVEYYRYLATLDARTCSVCGALDGKHFRVDNAKIGINFPPMHPNDRCSTVAYDPDEQLDGVRIARDPKSGKNYKVPQGMTYEEWRESIIEKYGAGALEKHQKMIANKKHDTGQHAAVKKVLGKEAPASVADFQNLKYNNKQEYHNLTVSYKNKQQADWQSKIIRDNSSISGYKVLEKPSDIPQWAKDQASSWLPEEKGALKYYTSHEFTSINRFLRGKADAGAFIREKIDSIKTAIDKSDIPENIVVWRGAGLSNFSQGEALKTKPIDLWEDERIDDKAFVSTSMLKSSAFDDKPIFMQILVPAGSKGAYIFEVSEFEEEYEMLFQAGSRFKILKAEQNSGKTFMQVLYEGVT